MNSILVYTKLNKQSYFTSNNIYEFVSYLNRNRINYYLNSLLDANFIYIHHISKGGKITYYSLSDLSVKLLGSLSSLYSSYVESLYFGKE